MFLLCTVDYFCNELTQIIMMMIMIKMIVMISLGLGLYVAMLNSRQLFFTLNFRTVKVHHLVKLNCSWKRL